MAAVRVVHFSDLHLGVELYGRPLSDRPWSSRMQDFLDSFDYMVEYAIGEGADAVIFAGDAYKTREPTQTQQREFASRISRLSEAGIASFLVVGNHDLPNAQGRAHALEIFRTLNVPGVYLGDQAWFAAEGVRPQLIETRGGPLQVAFVPWPQIGHLLAAEPENASMTIDQVHHRVEELLTGAISEQAARIDPALPSVLACHLSVNDFIVESNRGSEQWMTVGTVPTVLKSNLSQSSFDYIALGHHHNHMDLQLSTPCFYAGSMQPVDFGEEGQKKGVMVFDLDPTRPLGERTGGAGTPRFIEVPARRFISLTAHPQGDDPTPEVCSLVQEADTDDAIVRVEINLSSAQAAHFRLPDVRRALAGAHQIAGVRVVLPSEVRNPALGDMQPDTAAPLEVLEIYLKSRDVDEARRERLLAAAGDVVELVDEGAPQGS